MRWPTKVSTFALGALVMWTASCTKAVRIETTEHESVRPGATYRITTTDNRVYIAKHLEIAGELISFTSDRQRIELPAKDVLKVERLDFDQPKTAVVVIAVGVAAIAGFWMLLNAFAGSLVATD